MMPLPYREYTQLNPIFLYHQSVTMVHKREETTTVEHYVMGQHHSREILCIIRALFNTDISYGHFTPAGIYVFANSGDFLGLVPSSPEELKHPWIINGIERIVTHFAGDEERLECEKSGVLVSRLIREARETPWPQMKKELMDSTKGQLWAYGMYLFGIITLIPSIIALASGALTIVGILGLIVSLASQVAAWWTYIKKRLPAHRAQVKFLIKLCDLIKTKKAALMEKIPLLPRDKMEKVDKVDIIYQELLDRLPSVEFLDEKPSKIESLRKKLKLKALISST